MPTAEERTAVQTAELEAELQTAVLSGLAELQLKALKALKAELQS